MTKPMTTQEKLLHHARRLLWAQGFSNVSVRQIAGAAEVDVALISRYFGSKMGLFDATLVDAFENPVPAAATPDDVIDMIIVVFQSAPRGGDVPSPLRMILTNAHDEAVGDKVRALTHHHFYHTMLRIMGTPAKTALFISVLMGISVVEKTLQLPDYPDPQSPEYGAMLRHMLRAAIAYEGPIP